MAQIRSTKADADTPSALPLLRRADQVTVAMFVVVALVAMSAYWVVRGGPRGELIEIDRAGPLEARFQVDINKAEAPELAELPEIGPTLAQRIVDTRAQSGPFRDHDDLRRVRGIGPVTLERIRPYLLPMPQRGSVAGTAEGEPGKL